MVKPQQMITALIQSSSSEVVRTPTATVGYQRTSAPTPSALSLEQSQSIGVKIGRESVLKVLNSLVQDSQFSELADDQTENFIRQIIRRGAGGETAKQSNPATKNIRQGAEGETLEQLSLATNKYQFLEVLQRMAKREKVSFNYQVRQLISTKADTLPSPKIGCIWA